MILQPPPVLDYSTVNKKQITSYIRQNIPIVIKNYSTQWKAHQLWTPEYLKQHLKNIKVPLYNNNKSNAYTPVNKPDDYLSFAEYIDKLIHYPEHKWRLFLFNIYTNAPQLLKDIHYPTDIISPIVKWAPMLFIGGKGSITHLHFDIDYSSVLHIQIYGKKKFLLFPYHQQHLLYRKPFEVLAWPDFSNYTSRMEELQTHFPKLKEAKGYEVILNPGEALLMPPGCWHHIEYIETSIAISFRAVNQGLTGIMKGLWNLLGMRTIDTIMKKIAPQWWHTYKVKNTKYFDKTLSEKFLFSFHQYPKLS
ncbi:MAG: cupin-like domain-containing protein [Bacteroidia bacterium]|nr:cupin-like domain-containing protein [Bacteroidia bacterium]